MSSEREPTPPLVEDQERPLVWLTPASSSPLDAPGVELGCALGLTFAAALLVGFAIGFVAAWIVINGW